MLSRARKQTNKQTKLHTRNTPCTYKFIQLYTKSLFESKIVWRHKMKIELIQR